MACDYIKVLDLAQQGKWDAAHLLVQPYSGECAYLIHGYLHRVEGDLDNADYWYKRAKTEMPENSLKEEFERLYTLCGSKNQ